MSVDHFDVNITLVHFGKNALFISLIHHQYMTKVITGMDIKVKPGVCLKQVCFFLSGSLLNVEADHVRPK